MAKKIFGTDLDRGVTATVVRDAIIRCFYEAHCEDVELGSDDKEVKEGYCYQVVRTAFEKTRGNFENPSKEEIIRAMDSLREFAKNFRDPKLIEKNYAKIMSLVKKI